MIQDTQKRLVALKNEVKAQKTASGLAYSQMLMPENTPTRVYSGTASLSGSGDTPVARLRFRFQRTDGIADPPLINFACSANYSPSYKQFAEANGFSFTGRSSMYLERQDVVSYIHGLGDGYVDFYVDFQSAIRTALFSLNSIQIYATCSAITGVKGSFVVERLI